MIVQDMRNTMKLLENDEMEDRLLDKAVEVFLKDEGSVHSWKTGHKNLDQNMLAVLQHYKLDQIDGIMLKFARKLAPHLKKIGALPDMSDTMDTLEASYRNKLRLHQESHQDAYGVDPNTPDNT